MLRNCLKVALIQSLVKLKRLDNVAVAEKMIEKATKKGAQLICLPETFNYPFTRKHFSEYAENIPNGPTCAMLSKSAREHSIYLVGGSIPEVDADGKLYQTTAVWNTKGHLILKYRKLHLFDIHVPNFLTYEESSLIVRGNEFGIFDMVEINVKAGVGICHDLAFSELAHIYRMSGCNLLIYPAAYSMQFGPLQWEAIQKTRASDNQCYVLAISPATGTKGYIPWAHSQITDPWGKVISQAGHEETIIYGNLDFDECDRIRQQSPILTQRRTDLYDTVINKKH